MKWGKRGMHSPPTYLINHVFPISWLMKLKRKSGSFRPGTEQAKCKGKIPEMARCSSMPTKWKEGRFYSGSDDLYWRLSFGDDTLEDKKCRDVRSLWYDSDDEFSLPKSRCKSSKPREVNRLTVPEIKDITKKQYKVIHMQEKDQLKGMKVREQNIIAQAGYARKDQEQRSFDRRVLKEKKSNMSKRYLEEKERALQLAQENIFKNEPLKTVKLRDELQKSRVIDHGRKSNLICPSCSSRMANENCIFDYLDLEDANANPEEEFSSEMQKLQSKKINEIVPKNEHHRLSVHVSRPVRIKGRKSSRKMNSPSRKNAAKNECKTKATGDMKKGTRKKRIIKDTDIGVEAETVFDSYAVKKSSHDPQQDFRDSMLEMIIDQEIKQPEELEELLVCYLTHNCDEYHDLIIKVFQQVWFDLNQVYIAAA
ncbi:hypothetical protein LIER_04620 [Lithospermum erythrorhizon]|uniref:Transcription repressor n=1 Tax=Lithospermum erythrorhizon TaxID=34254 RepID=A0AAV3NXD9_LITER